MKNAESISKNAEQNSSYCSFFDLETSPLLLYYYIIINREGMIFSPEFPIHDDEKKKKSICPYFLSRLMQNIKNDGKPSKYKKKDGESFSIF